MLHSKCNITHNNKEYEVCIYYNTPPIKFVTLINKINHNRSHAFERTVIKTGEGGGRLKPVLRDPNLALSFCHGSKHIVVRSFPMLNIDLLGNVLC